VLILCYRPVYGRGLPKIRSSVGCTAVVLCGKNWSQNELTQTQTTKMMGCEGTVSARTDPPGQRTKSQIGG
jgi:hypothetical protein